MSEPLFHSRPQGLTVRELATLTGAIPGAGADLRRRITGINALAQAGPHEIAFLDDERDPDQLALTRAGACFLRVDLLERRPFWIAALVVEDPYRAFVAAARALFPDVLRPSSLFPADPVAPGAFVHPSVRLETGAVVDPGAVIGPEAEIGTQTVIGPGAVIGPAVRIGRGGAIGAGTTITNALIGDRVVIHPGCRIGQTGFSGSSAALVSDQRPPHVGRVIVQDDVEIGANATIDRGTDRDTVIGEGTKIDNLFRVGHNAAVGRHCVLTGRSSLPSGMILDDGVVLEH